MKIIKPPYGDDRLVLSGTYEVNSTLASLNRRYVWSDDIERIPEIRLRAFGNQFDVVYYIDIDFEEFIEFLESDEKILKARFSMERK